MYIYAESFFNVHLPVGSCAVLRIFRLGNNPETEVAQSHCWASTIIVIRPQHFDDFGILGCTGNVLEFLLAQNTVAPVRVKSQNDRY